MNLKERIDAFAALGEVLRNGLTGKNNNISDKLFNLIDSQHTKNKWFTPENVRMSLNAIAENLTSDNLTTWTNVYPELIETRKAFNTGVIMAGNLPLVGFHDYLSVLISGNNLIAKTSSKDPDLILFINEILCRINPDFEGKVRLTEGTLTAFDAIIATGSDNSSRYFEYYFGKYPNIIRKNRNSIAIVDGYESEEELNGLGKDIFSYFGLGCRNVSKIFVPDGYDFSKMICTWEGYSGVVKNTKYVSNYDFSKAVYMVNKESFIDTGYLLLKENSGLSSPVAVVYYEYYKSPEEILASIDNLKEKIQCIVSRNNIYYGNAQSPNLWDYADRIDTLEFLLKKNSPGII
jgi:hypothetical protein